jgi:hypothetical protein
MGDVKHIAYHSMKRKRYKEEWCLALYTHENIRRYTALISACYLHTHPTLETNFIFHDSHLSIVDHNTIHGGFRSDIGLLGQLQNAHCPGVCINLQVYVTHPQQTGTLNQLKVCKQAVLTCPPHPHSCGYQSQRAPRLPELHRKYSCSKHGSC